MSEFVSIAWPALLALAGFLVLIAHATWDHRRRYPRGRYSVRFEGPLGILTAEHVLTPEQARDIARRWAADDTREQTYAVLGPQPARPDPGDPEHAEQLQRAMRSAHSRGLHRGTTVLVPACPDCAAAPGNAWARVGWAEDGYVDDAGMYRSRRHPGRAG
jgi:hypothetical protein